MNLESWILKILVGKLWSMLYYKPSLFCLIKMKIQTKIRTKPRVKIRSPIKVSIRNIYIYFIIIINEPLCVRGEALLFLVTVSSLVSSLTQHIELHQWGAEAESRVMPTEETTDRRCNLCSLFSILTQLRICFILRALIC